MFLIAIGSATICPPNRYRAGISVSPSGQASGHATTKYLEQGIAQAIELVRNGGEPVRLHSKRMFNENQLHITSKEPVRRLE